MLNLKFVLRVVLTLIFVMFPIWKAYAHGGGGAKSPPPVKEQSLKPRAMAKKLDVMADSDIKELSSLKEMPEDVLFIRCTLSEYAVCRGLDISIFDLFGKRLLTGNTGVEGLVGFEGLKPNTKYIVRIDNPKYQGEIETISGRMRVINGDRRERYF